MEDHMNQSLFVSTNITSDFSSTVIDQVIGIATIVILFITMVSLGCTMELSKIKNHLMKPKGVAIALVAQFGVMPLTAFSLAKGFQMEPMEAVTVLICGCCPGGNLSNILALALQGDMNLSIVMTTCSTLLALGMMPLLLFLYCQGFSNLEKAVPYGSIAVALLMTLLPCAIGIFINHRFPRYSRIITKVGVSILLVVFMAVAILVGMTVGTTVFTVTSPRLLGTAALMPLAGFTLGYILAFICVARSKRTIAMETGCQNIQLCSTILKVAFPAEDIGALYLFPMVYIIFQLAEAFVLIALFRCSQLFRASKKGAFPTLLTRRGLLWDCFLLWED
uniref:Hepatic sodium/bile acid cotransporter n=1 Tax=Denticeps clupeoides TaxID=299321 RepID=A0AAY4BVN9_9TELE